MTTAPTPLPFLVPAANLAVGDVLPDSSDGTVKGGTIAEAVTHSSGVIKVVFTDRSRAAFTPDCLVEVASRRPGARLDAVVAELTALADTWERVSSGRDRSVMTCVDQLRALLGRLA